MGFKKLIRKRTIIWGASALLITGLLVTANVLMRDTYRSAVETLLGRKRAIVNKTADTIEFPQSFFTKEEAMENGENVTKEICEEGMILLKNENNALPLKKKAKVSVFGKNSVNLVYGGSGSAEPKGCAKKSIFEALTAAGFEYNEALADFYKDNKRSGDERSSNPKMDNDGVTTLKTGETPIQNYDGTVTSSYDKYNDAALVVFSRIAGEDWDLPRVADDNSARHYLELDNNERALLKHIVDSGKFAHIIVLMNSSNYIDLNFLRDNSIVDSSKIDACINIGSPGSNGIMALGRILNGEVNPSGHTVDLVYTNYRNDPTWQNFGDNLQGTTGDNYYAPNGVDLPDPQYHLIEYEEGIYMGYRYYETRGKGDEDWYNQNVIYPFGYGLSYTTFSEEIVNKSALEATTLSATEEFEISVKVTNTGNVKGKQVVQVYAEAPYEAGKIEKPYKVLAGFAKTKELGKNASDTVTIKINPYYFASFDNKDANGDGFKGFTLDAGNYVFHVATDSHHDIDTFTKNLANTYKFENDPNTGTKVEPLFDDVTYGGRDNPLVYLSRNNWTGTFPTTMSQADRVASNDLLDKLDAFESGNNETYDDKEMPNLPGKSIESATRLRDLAGAEYNDERWEPFLNQLSFEDLLALFNEGCYSTTAIEKDVDGDSVYIVPATESADGPTGLVSFMGNLLPGAKPAVYDCCYYCSECLVAQTYNLELAAKEAEAIGNEALVGNVRGDGLAYPGWYAPGVNLHRSPFSGRNTEYYSEDPFLTGRFAATVIDGVQKHGVYANVKHFAVNDQETHRTAYGIATWCDEQAMREMYFRPFEMAVKEGKSKGLMTSFNRLGTTWAGGDYRLVTKVLRNEWGFVGSVICDFHEYPYMDSKQMLYAGGDINLVSQKIYKLAAGNGKTNVKETNKKDVILLRESAHNLLYCIANSNIMKADIIGYKNPVWVNVLTGVTIGVGVATVGWGAWAITSALLKKEEVAAAGPANEANGETKTE